MDRIIFDRMAALDQTHWWYVARRHVLSAVIARKIKPAAQARILEIGCGTGHNFQMLGAFGMVDALEMDGIARTIANNRLGRPVGDATLPELIGVADGIYDIIALLDVLEHVELDLAALKSIRKKLKPGGKILITVPANQWMWSAHDSVHHHFRRYNRRTLTKVAGDAGLRVDLISHFNTLLFPLAAAFRVIGKITGRTDADDAQPTASLNTAFKTIFGFERYLIGRVPLPFGVSLLTILS